MTPGQKDACRERDDRKKGEVDRGGLESPKHG
jgi:hypothetical protein